MGSVNGLYAQQKIDLGRARDQIQKKEDNIDRLRLVCHYAQLQTTHCHRQEGGFDELSLQGGLFDGEVGEPKLPVTQRLIEIPFGAEATAVVTNYSLQEYDLADYGIGKIMPMQPPVSKNDVPEAMPLVINEDAYGRDEYFGQELARVQVLGTLRGYRIARVTVAPVRYNPVQNKIQVYNDIELEVRFSGADASLTHDIKAKTRSPYFDFIKDNILNEGVSRDYPDHPDLTRYPVKYVIIADRMFDGYLDELVRWKTRKGFEVLLSFTDEIGVTQGAIQSYLHGLYNSATPEDPAPSFVLFVGDTQQIPTYIGMSSQKVTDLYYASVDGDYFPEMYYGRFSAQTVEQLMPQIEKTLYYEQYQFVDPSYLDRVTLIAGWDDYWNAQIAQPTIRYGMENWFNEGNGYAEVYPYYGPNDYEGCYEDDKISVSMINYTAHCSETVWGTPALSASTIQSMHNEGFYPLAVGNCCESSEFGYGECVGESWVRADKKGAVCYLGSAPSTYWYEDAWWAMGAYHITNANLGQTPLMSQTTSGAYDAMHGEEYVSAGGLVLCGNLAVTEACNHGWSDAAQYYWEAYNVLGDPSLVTYHTRGTENVVTHEPTLFLGSDAFSLQAEPGSWVGLSKDGVLLGSGMVGEDDELTLSITPAAEGGFAELVVTKPQRIPYMKYIPIATPGQPFLMVTNADPVRFPYNQETELSVTVKNVGDQVVPDGTQLMLQATDQHMEVLNAQCIVNESIPVGGTAVIPNAFRVKASSDVYDGERFRMITTADCGDQVNADFYVTVAKPVFEYVDYSWSEGFSSGSSFDVSVTFRNVGGAAAESPVASIASSNPLLLFSPQEINLERIEAGETVTCQFMVWVPETVSESEMLELEVSLQDAGVSESQTISLVNLCNLVLELRDSGGNGWEGAALKMLFQDGTSPKLYELTEGSSATYMLSNRKGYKIRLSWINGSHDEECSFTFSYEDGTVIYESGSDLHGNLLLTTIDCTINVTEVAESEACPQVNVYPNPASQQVTVVSATPMSRCLLMNSLGQVVMDKRVNETMIQLDVDRLAPGIYLLRAQTADGDAIQRVMIR